MSKSLTALIVSIFFNIALVFYGTKCFDKSVSLDRYSKLVVNKADLIISTEGKNSSTYKLDKHVPVIWGTKHVCVIYNRGEWTDTYCFDRGNGRYVGPL